MEENLLPCTRDDEKLLPRRQNPMAGCLVAGAVTAIFLVLPVVLIIQQLLFADFTPPPRPETSVVVDGFSGLDGAAAHVPRAFNLSLSVDNPRGSTFDVCVGGEAAVLYDGVPLATGLAEDRCVPPGGAWRGAIHAASGGVGLPPELAALMATEKRDEGDVKLEVRLISLNYGWYVRCTPSLVGGAASPIPCTGHILKDQSDGIRRVIRD
uniref:Late embryogenesis abundant protein LEA-2 subgroup domain-containing protein n=1 Tax=Oryza nivara TaxID=4536 RepID=A0A0E0GXN5_ORYNI